MIAAIQTTVSGYSGKPCTLYSSYNDKTLVLMVAVLKEYTPERREGCVVITNDRNIDRDSLFMGDDMNKAITAYFELLAGVAADGKSPRIKFNDEKAGRARPSDIEKDGIDSSGQRYRLNESISNAQIATLVTACYVGNLSAINDASDQLDSLNNLILLGMGGIVTI